jgi:hypothetical protein
MSIDSNADRDLVIEDEDAESVAGGRANKTRSAKRHVNEAALGAPIMTTISTPAYTPPPGVPESAQADCVPELAYGEAGSQDAG